MKKEEFISFLTESLDALVESRGYDEVSFTSSFEKDGISEDEVLDDYPDEDDSDYVVASEDSKDSGLFYTSGKEERRKAPEVAGDFTDELLSALISKFKPSKEVKEGVFNTRQRFEDIPSELNTVVFGGATNPLKISYTRYEKPLEIPDDLVVNSSDDLESTLNSFNSVLEYVMAEVERIYGGKDRITDIAIYSDIVIINNVSFEPMLKDSLIKSLPYDLQYAVRNGCFAYMFDFSYLRKYKNLVNFSVDNVDFLYSKVRLDLGKGRDFEPKDLFSICKSLNTVRVGEFLITRRNKDSFDDVFSVPRKRTEIADKIESLGMRGVRGTWGCAKDIFLDKDSRLIWKAIKLAVVGGTATAVTTATLGFKLTRALGKAGKSVAKGVGNIVDAVKSNS